MKRLPPEPKHLMNLWQSEHNGYWPTLWELHSLTSFRHCEKTENLQDGFVAEEKERGGREEDRGRGGGTADRKADINTGRQKKDRMIMVMMELSSQ